MSTTLKMDRKRLREEFLEANLQQLKLGKQTRQLIAASTRADVVVCYDERGTPALRLADKLVGTPPAEAVVAQAVRSSPVGASFVVFGLGVGHTVRLVRSLTQSQVVVYEPRPEVVRAVLEEGPSDLGGVQVVCSLHDLTQLWSSLTAQRSDLVVIATPGYSQHFAEEERELQSQLGDLMRRGTINDITYRTRARSWLKTLLGNLELLTRSPPLMALEGKLQNVPAFIVGAGPSLDKNIGLLDEASKKGLVIAVNSSVPALSSRGIQPQVVACIESMDVSALLRGLPVLDKAIRAFSLCTHPNTVSTGSGPLAPIFEDVPEIGPPLAELTGTRGLPVCASVSTIAFSLAQRLGCNPIVLVGQDLAYSGGRVYATGSPYERSRALVDHDGSSIGFEWCPTMQQIHEGTRSSGTPEALRVITSWDRRGKVPTKNSYHAILSWFEHAARLLRDDCPEARLINATEGGAHIEGFEARALSDVLRELPERSITVEAILEQLEAAGRKLDLDEVQRWCVGVSTNCRQTEQAARRVEQLAGRALEAMQSRRPNRITRSFAKLQKAENELRNRARNVAMLDAWSFGDVDRALRDHPIDNNDDRASAHTSILREQAVARAIVHSARSLKMEVDTAQNGLRLALQTNH